jgi:hypothetical protein
MVAIVHTYIDPDATGLATGLSWDDAFISAASARLAMLRDLIATNEIIWFHMRNSLGGVDTTALNCGGFVSDATRYTVWWVEQGYRHNGQTGTGYQITTTTAGGAAVTVSQPNNVVVGLSARNLSTAYSNTAAFRNYLHGGVLLFGCLGQCAGTNGRAYYITSGAWDLVSCIGRNSGFGIAGTNWVNTRAYACTMSHCTFAYYREGGNGSQRHLYNCLAIFNNWSGGDFYLVGSWTGDYCGSDQTDFASLPGGNTGHHVGGLAVGDFEVDEVTPAEGSAAIDAGLDLTASVAALNRADFTLPTIDALGNPRPTGAPWDMGAIERQIIVPTLLAEISVRFRARAPERAFSAGTPTRHFTAAEPRRHFTATEEPQ